MTIKSKQLFILIGDDKTGKTTLQKLLIERISNLKYATLPTNLGFDIEHPEIKRKYKNISFGNRSYQEKKDTYKSVDEYFSNHFTACDIAFISSHLVLSDIEEMIRNGKQKFYNVSGIFWSNSIDHDNETNSQISLLDWNERLVIDNAWSDNADQIERQLNNIADSIVFFIVNRTSIS